MKSPNVSKLNLALLLNLAASMVAAAALTACGGIEYDRDGTEDDLLEVTPCEDLDVDQCASTSHCRAEFDIAPCPAIGCMEDDCPVCEGEIFVGCVEVNGCEALGEDDCLAADGCAPMYEGACLDCEGPGCGCTETFVACTETDLPDGCQSDSDCSADEYCAIERGAARVACYCPPCEGGDGCPECDCPDLPPEPTGNGVCLPRPTSECFSDFDCAPGMRCDYFEAQGAEAPPECVCPACDGPGCECNCADPGFRQAAGVCVPDERICTWDGECNPGEFCEMGYADPAPCMCDCAPDNGECFCDCGAPEPAGVCRPSNVECYSDWDCGEGYACDYMGGGGACACDVDCDGDGCPPCDCMVPEAGVCVWVGIDECQSDSDCGSGGFCEMYDTCASLDCGPAAPNRCVWPHPTCDEFGEVFCAAEPPVCPEGTIVAAKNGCWECVDPDTCEPPVRNEDYSMGAITDACAPDDGPAVQVSLGASYEGAGLTCGVFGDTTLEIYAFAVELPLDAGTTIPVDLDEYGSTISRCSMDHAGLCELATEGYVSFDNNVGEGLLGSYSLRFADGWIEGTFFAAFCEGDGAFCG